MIKIILLITIVVCFGYIGYGFSRYYLKRLKFFVSSISLCDRLMIDINFSKMKLVEIIEKNQSNFSKDMKKTLQTFVFYLKNEEAEYSEKISFNLSGLLSSDEINTYVLFLKSLGRFDSKNQIKEIENYKSKFEKYRNDAEVSNKTFGNLFIKLGVIMGLLFAILLI